MAHAMQQIASPEVALARQELVPTPPTVFMMGISNIIVPRLVGDSLNTFVYLRGSVSF